MMFAVAKSGFPSPLMSPMLTQLGALPVGKVSLGAKVGMVAKVAVVLSRMETLLLSRLPQLNPEVVAVEVVEADKAGLTASWEGDFGGESGGGSAGGGGVEQDGDRVAVFVFAIAMSGFPSPLKSPMLMELGNVSWEVNFGAKPSTPL